MLEDDIEYLGTRLARQPPPPSSPSHPFTATSRPVTAISLHVDKSGSDNAQRMLFQRVNGTVEIGRKGPPPEDPHLREKWNDTKNALFRCPVVSRKHGKITFSDSGLAYITDTNSHHGTYLRSKGNTINRKLAAGSPTLLHDGDVLTFGKEVGREDHGRVTPVIAHVEFVYSSQSSRAETSRKPSGTHGFHTSLVSFRSKPNSSGRYGVDILNSASDESSSSDNEYSEPEELPSKPEQDSGVSKGGSASALVQVVGSIAKIPIRCSSGEPFMRASPFAQKPTVEDSASDCSSDAAESRHSSPEFYLGAQANEVTLIGAYPPSRQQSPKPASDAPAPVAEKDDKPVAASKESAEEPEDGVDVPVEANVPLNPDPLSAALGPNPHSEYSLPLDELMNCVPPDLPSAPLPPVSLLPADDEFFQSYPVLYGYPPRLAPPSGSGAQPRDSFDFSVHMSSQLASFTSNDDASQVNVTPAPVDDMMMDNVTKASETTDGTKEPSAFTKALQFAFGSKRGVDESSVQELKDSAQQTKTLLSELESRIQTAEKKVSNMSLNHESLEREFRELKNMCGGLIDQADATTHFTVPELQDRVKMLEQQSDNKLSSLTGRLDEICGKFKADTDVDMDIGENASKQLESMRVWEAEMKKTVEEVMKDISDSLKSVKDAERAALESLRNTENDINKSLKRKREDDEVEHANLQDVQTIAGSSSSADIRPVKRARTLGRVVLHTATAAAVGVVATWTALAFS